MTQKTFSTIENGINHWWENMLEEDLKFAIEEEKRIAIENNRFHEGRYILFSFQFIKKHPIVHDLNKFCLHHACTHL